LLQALLEPVPEGVSFLRIVDGPAQATCHMVNRNAGAGARILIDRLLRGKRL
jgi:molybdate-binding protein